MKIKFLMLAVAAIVLGSIAGYAQSQNKISIVPLPETIVEGTGYFLVNGSTPVYYETTSPELKNTAEMLSGYMKDILGYDLKIKASSPKKGAINLVIDSAMASEEYQLNVMKDRVVITGGAANGVFYGIQTLRQLIPTMSGNTGVVAGYNIPVVKIEDKPYFAHRGGMLDVCRHFFSVEDVKNYIDILALHKMNIFHWHLTDDQGWRIEIKKYPELTEIGSKRKATIKGHAAMPSKTWEYDGIEYGGFYTQEQIKEIIDYAAERYVTVVPEIEMPGHAVAALASYKWLGCVDKEYEVWGSFGVNPEVFCAGKETTFEFLQNVLTEVIELFPSRYIHIGGDECPKVRWKACPFCQERIKNENLKDEFELQSYLIKRMEKWLQQHDREIIGWDEILEGGVSPTATVMSWRGPKGGVEAAKKGNKVIMAPNNYYYLDYYPSKDRNAEPAAIGGYNPMEKVYSFDPFDKLDETQKRAIIGVQGNLWTEYIKHFDHVEYMILPRLAAVAETAWAVDRKEDYSDFIKRVKVFSRMYDQNAYHYARHIFRPDGWYEPVTPGFPGSW